MPTAYRFCFQAVGISVSFPGTIKPSTAEIISKSDFEKDWKKQKNEFHQYLVQYFAAVPEGQRRTEELPWQQLMAGDMQRLKKTLTNPGYVSMTLQHISR